MSHVTYIWVMSHRTCPTTWVFGPPFAHVTHEWVMSPMNESCHTRTCSTKSVSAAPFAHVTHEWVMSPMNLTSEQVTTENVYGELIIMRGLVGAQLFCLHTSPIAINKPYYLKHVISHGYLDASLICVMTHSYETWLPHVLREHMPIHMSIWSWTFSFTHEWVQSQ